jgi:hypothetical protein
VTSDFLVFYPYLTYRLSKLLTWLFFCSILLSLFRVDIFSLALMHLWDYHSQDTHWYMLGLQFPMNVLANLWFILSDIVEWWCYTCTVLAYVELCTGHQSEADSFRILICSYRPYWNRDQTVQISPVSRFTGVHRSYQHGPFLCSLLIKHTQNSVYLFSLCSYQVWGSLSNHGHWLWLHA